jgi:hypothetical protein
VIFERGRLTEAFHRIRIVVVGVMTVVAAVAPLMVRIRREEAQVNVRGLIVSGGARTAVAMADTRPRRQ